MLSTCAMPAGLWGGIRSAGNLHQHRECLFYRDGGFRFEGDRLLLVTGAGTLTLKLKSCPGFMVARLRRLSLGEGRQLLRDVQPGADGVGESCHGQTALHRRRFAGWQSTIGLDTACRGPGRKAGRVCEGL